MELSSQEAIAALLESMAARRAPARNCGAPPVARPQRRERKARCQCGQCQQCSDNARWERIFREKFSDPDYYTWRGVQRGSPLTSM